MAITSRTGSPASGMTFPLPPAKVQAYADTNGVAPAVAGNQNIPGFDWPELRTPPAENSEPAWVPLGDKDGQGVCTLTIEQPYARMYVDGVAKRYTSAAFLRAAYDRAMRRADRRPGAVTPYADSLWDGARFCNESADRFVDGAVRHGCLLHLVPA